MTVVANNLLQVKFLPPRWRITEHPLYAVARARLDPFFSPMTDVVHLGNSTDEPVVPNSVEVDAYAAIVVPPANSMYFHLMQKAKEVVALGTSSAAAYKRTQAIFNHLLSFPPGSAGSSDISGLVSMRAPQLQHTKKRGRTSTSDLLNRSSLSRQRRIPSVKGRRCSSCLKNGVVATDHRKGGNCPFFAFDTRGLTESELADSIDHENPGS